MREILNTCASCRQPVVIYKPDDISQARIKSLQEYKTAVCRDCNRNSLWIPTYYPKLIFCQEECGRLAQSQVEGNLPLCTRCSNKIFSRGLEAQKQAWAKFLRSKV